MPGGGSKPGERRGGRQKGTPNKGTTLKRAILVSAKEQFEANDYDPLQSMIDLAQKLRPGKHDVHKFNMHQTLARKYWPDVSAVKLTDDLANPLQLSVKDRQARLTALQRQLAERNGVSHGNHAPDH